mmetsp:Transcript_45951/g.46414  ORF Transcript_45951/g.46414 Transcript_45951/m.46414 type:complete len:104 (+) Transcript_45951:513-824(+)
MRCWVPLRVTQGMVWRRVLPNSVVRWIGLRLERLCVDRVIRGRIPKPTSAETVTYNFPTITVQNAIYGCLPPRNHGIAIPVAFAGSAAVKISITATYAACVFQ